MFLMSESKTEVLLQEKKREIKLFLIVIEL